MKTPTNKNQKVRNLSRLRERLQRKAPRRPSRKNRHRIPANLTRESQWETGGEPPQVRTSRMFIGMLSLHLVAAIGLVAFHYFGHDPAPKMMSQNTAPSPAPARPLNAVTPTVPAPALPGRTAGTPVLGAGMSEHVVRMDETWDTIAAARGLTVEGLKAANPGVDCNVGRLLMLPPTPNRISAAPLPAKNSQSSGAPPPAALAEMDSKKSMIRYAPNPELVPTIAPPPVTPSPTLQMGAPVKAAAINAPSGSKVHVVAKGETIFSIAKRHRISEKSLLKFNGISDAAKIHPGQKLKVPKEN